MISDNCTAIRNYFKNLSGILVALFLVCETTPSVITPLSPISNQQAPTSYQQPIKPRTPINTN